MGFLPPNINPPFTTVPLERLEASLKHVMLVVPLGKNQWGKARTFDIKTGGKKDGESIYGDFLEYFNPQLSEIDHENHFGLKKLIVPTEGGESSKNTFLVGAQNYFFQRGIQNSHEHFNEFKGEDRNDFLSPKPHRGSHFIKDLQINLKRFCSFQSENYKLINAFVTFVAMCSDDGKDPKCFAPITKEQGLQPGWAEILLDFFYQGTCQDDFPRLPWTPTGDACERRVWAEAESDDFNTAFAELANMFRVSLLGKNSPEGDKGSRWALLCCGEDNSFGAHANPFSKKGAYGEEFRKRFSAARTALTSILEMISSRCLPQEALAWLLEELFDAVHGKGTYGDGRGITSAQWDKVCMAVLGGKSKTAQTEDVAKEGEQAEIAQPTTRGLDGVQRLVFKQQIQSGLDLIVDAIAADDTDEKEKGFQKLKQELGADFCGFLTDDPSFKNFVKLLVPADDEKRSDKNAKRKSLLQGAKAFFKLMLEVRVFPRLFGLPELTFEDLINRLNSENYALMLQAVQNIGGGQETTLSAKLKESAEKCANEISAALSNKEEPGRLNNSIKTIWQKEEPAFRRKLLQSLCESFGSGAAELEGKVELFQKAMDLPLHCVGLSDKRVVSSMRHLVPFTAVHGEAINNSEPLTTDQLKLISQYALSGAKVLVKLREYNASVEKAKRNLEKAKEATIPIGKFDTSSNENSDEKVKENAQAELRSAEQALEREKTKAESQVRIARDLGLLVQGEESTNERVSSEGDLIQGSEMDGGALSVTKMINQSLIHLLKNNEQASAEEIAGKVAENFQNETNIEALRELLKSYERLNHRVFEVYTENQQNHSSFCRQVEATTLGRIIAATGQRCGLEGKGSGLLKMLMDLVREAKDENGHISASDMLSKCSLTEYIDGALIDKGQQIQNLRDSLKKCADESFKNITNFISELQSIRYLFHKAPKGSKITVFNGDSNELFQLLNQPRPKFFAVDAQAQAEDLPGMVYLSECGGLNKLAGLAFRQEGEAIGVVIPPVLRRAVTSAEADVDKLVDNCWFPLFSVGPDLPLNPANDAMPTTIPSPYPVMLGFLQLSAGFKIKMDIGNLNSTKVRKFNNETREFIFGNTSIEAEMAAFFSEFSSFHSDYYLYVLLRVYAEIFILSQCSLNDVLKADFFKHWTISSASFGNLLNDNEGISIKKCFAGGSVQQFGFSRDGRFWRVKFVDNKPTATRDLSDASTWYNIALDKVNKIY